MKLNLISRLFAYGFRRNLLGQKCPARCRGRTQNGRLVICMREMLNVISRFQCRTLAVAALLIEFRPPKKEEGGEGGNLDR